MSRLMCLALAFLSAALLLAPSALPAADDAPQPRRYAVLVGVNHYQHNNLPDLQYAEADAADMAGLLKDAGYDVTLLTNAAGDKDDASKPTKANIEKALHDVLRRCQKGDAVVVGLSGHGMQFSGSDDCYFCPQDARPFKDEADTLVSLGKVYTELDKSFAGVKVLLVDACRDDPASKGARGVDADSAPRPPRGVAALYSCSAGERSFESEEYKHGVFFHFVLEGLRSEAADADGEVTFAGLSGYVQKQVPRAVRQVIKGGAQQSPNLKADLSGEPPVLVSAGEAKGRAALARGKEMYDHQDYDGAIKALTETVRLLPRNMEARHYRGNAYHHQNENNKAIADYTEAIRLDPNLAYVYLNRGNAYYDQKENEKAIADYTEAIRIDPKYAKAFNNRGIVYDDKKDYDKAVADYTEAIRIDSTYTNAYLSRGYAYEDKKEYDKAITDYTEVIWLDPKNAVAFNCRGCVFYNGKKNYDKAIADCTEAIRIDPKFAPAYSNRGLAYQAKGDKEHAAADFAEYHRLTDGK